MTRRVVVVEPGDGHRVGNVEFLARTEDTPFFNLSTVELEPGHGVEGHRHEAEDDSFLVLEGTLSLTVGDDRREVRAGPGTFVLVPAGTFHALLNRGPASVRFLNVHAPGGFDRRIGIDGPPRPRLRRPSVGSAGRTLGLVGLLLAVVIATGSGGVAAAALAKSSVGSAQIKNGGVRTQDLGVGAVRSTQIGDGATITVDVPRNGFIDVSGSAAFNAAAQSGVLQAELYQDDHGIQRMRWDAGDKDGQYDQHQSVEAVVPVTAGTHTYTLRVAEGLSSGTAYSGYLHAQVVVRFFPEGQASVGAARAGGGQATIG